MPHTLRPRLLAPAVVALALLLLAPPAHADDASAAPAVGAEPVRVLVRYDRLPPVGKRLTGGGFDAAVRRQFPRLSALALELPADQVENLRRQPGVLLVEPDPERHAFAVKAPNSEVNPALGNGLYGLITTRATLAHKRKVTGVGATVCVADEGLDKRHPDLIANYRGGLDLVDDDGEPDVGPGSSQQHGTHVAGTIVAALNRIGVRGVAYNARLYHARVLNSRGSGRSSDIMEGVRRLVEDFGCRIVNLSLGGSSESAIERDFYAEIAARGVLVVAASGNESTAEEPVSVGFPAAYPGVLAVGAVDVANQHADFSNTGEALDLSAPGVAVLSSVPRDTGQTASVKTPKSYLAIGMVFAGLTNGASGLLIDCGSGNTADEFPSRVAGNIALIRRGDATFAAKVENAMNAGARAAIVYNNVSGDFAGTLGTERTPDGRAWIPAIGVSDATGDALQRSLNKRVTVINATSHWAQFSGTSMATPMVAGVAALMLGVNPALTGAELTEILLQTAAPLGDGGFSTTYGWGLVDADAAVRAAQARR